MLAPDAPADAQEVPGLRGAVPDGSTAATGTPSALDAIADYDPVSEGALPEEAEDDTTLFPDDAFAGTEVEASSRTPSTATARRQGRDPVEPAAATEEEPDPRERIERAEAVEKIGVPDDADRVEAIQDLDPPTIEQDPYAATGVRVGTFILRPSIEQGITATSNADYSTEGTEAVLSETTLRLNAASDWVQHSASLNAWGTFRKSLSGYEVEDLRAGGIAALDLDITEELRGRATLEYDRAPETAASPVIIPGTVEDPIRQSFGGSLGLEKDVGKARFGITGRIEHDLYGDADLIDGTVLSQKERDSTLATVALRAGYEVSPAFTPFVEVEGGRRFYDEEVDSAGFERSSDRIAASAGVEVDISEKLGGEFSAGWLREEFDDDRLEPIEGPTLNALLTWSPERDTTIGLLASTIVEGTTTAGESGSILHTGRLSMERRIRANLTANAFLGVGYRDYTGSDDSDVLLNAEVSATWWLNRFAGITGRLRHESQRSDIEGRDYDAESIFLGMTLQR